MHGEPVTIRTIDPPLHEFLPKREELMVEIARLEAQGKSGGELEAKRKLLHRCRRAPSWRPPASSRRRA
jgi:pyruvate,orthophosphate dikinase